MTREVCRIERTLCRLSYARRWLLAQGQYIEAGQVNLVTLEVARRHSMRVVEADAWEIELAIRETDGGNLDRATAEIERLRRAIGYDGPPRP